MEQSERYKQALLRSIEREWKALMSVVAQLSPAEMETADGGGWSPKDNLAHLTQWLKALTGYHMEHKPAEEVLGLPGELAENFDFNRVNGYMFEQNKRRTAEDVLSELKAKYGEVVRRLEAMGLDELMSQRHADDPEKRPLLLWVLGNTSEHFAEHREIIERVLR